MASKNLTELTDYAGGQAPADLMYICASPFAPTDDRKSTLNDLFAYPTKNITDKTLRFQASSSPSVSSASQGALTFNGTVFQISENGGAWTSIGNIRTSGFTATRIPIASAANTLIDDAGLSFNTSTDILSVGTTGGGGVALVGQNGNYNVLASANPAANRTMYLPDAAPTAGQFLYAASVGATTVLGWQTAPSGSGSANQVAVWGASNALAGSSALTFTSGVLAISGTSNPGVTATNTAAGAAGFTADQAVSGAASYAFNYLQTPSSAAILQLTTAGYTPANLIKANQLRLLGGAGTVEMLFELADASRRFVFGVNNAEAASINATSTLNLVLGVASSLTGRVRLYNSVGANYTQLSAGNAAASLNYILPADTPSAGQVLTATAPSGSDVTLSWETPSGGSSLTAQQIGFGSGANALTGSADFTYVDATGVIDLTKSLNSSVRCTVGNLNNGNAAQARFGASADVAGASLAAYSSGFATSGLIVANTSLLDLDSPFALIKGQTAGSLTVALGNTARMSLIDSQLAVTTAPTTAPGLSVGASTLTSGSLVSFTASGTGAASNTKTGLAVQVSGANATASQTTYGARFSNTSTGTTNTNIALSLTASGAATINTALEITAGRVIQTSNLSTAFVTGPNGATNPTFLIDSSATSAATGISLTSAAAGSGVTLGVLSSGANESLSIVPKGTGGISISHSASVNSTTPLLSVNSLLNTATNTTYYGARVNATIRPTVTNTAGVVVLNATATVDSANPPSAVYAVQATTNHNASGTLSAIIGFSSTVAVYASASAASTVSHFQAVDVFTNSLGTVATQYGVRIPALVNAQTNWALYTEGSTDSSLGGKLGINRSTTIASQLDVSSSASFLPPARFWASASPSAELGLFLNIAGVKRFSVGLPASNSQTTTMVGGNGETYQQGTLSENVTLNTGGTTTDSTILLPAGSVITGLTARISQTVTGGGITSLSLGDANNATRFSNAGLGLTVSQTLTLLANSPQTSAGAVRITANGGTPTAGQVLITITYQQLVPAYSALDKMPTGNPFNQSRIVYNGDSLTLGVGVIGGDTYPVQTIALLGGANPTNTVAVNGQTIATMVANAPTLIDPLYSAANGRDTVVYWGGTNDIAFATGQATATYNNIVAYGTARRTVGWRTYVLTILPRSDVGVQANFEVDRQAINASIRANWATFADGLIDVAANPLIGDAGDETNTQYYTSDRVHLNNAGARIVAEMVAAGIQPADTNTIAGTTLRNIAPSTATAAAEFQAALGAAATQAVFTIKNGSGVAVGNWTAGGSLALNNLGTAPSASVTDTCLAYVADVAAGDANLFVRAENGAISRLTNTIAILDQNFNATTTTLANITGGSVYGSLTFNLAVSTIYQFEAVLFCSADATGGIKVAMGGTAVAAGFTTYQIDVIANSTNANVINAQKTALASASGVAGDTVYEVRIQGSISVSTAGTLTVQFAQNAANGTSSVLRGSYFKLTQGNL